MIAHYLRTALRGFARDKVPTAVNLVSLTMGLMGFIAAYALSQDLLSVGSRYEHADRIRVVTQTMHLGELGWNGIPITGASVARYVETDLPALEAVVRATSTPSELAVAAGDYKGYRSVVLADPGYLEIFPDPLASASADAPLDSPQSAVISAASAQAIFGEASPLGRRFRLADAVDVTVTGVFAEPPSDQMGSSFDLLVSLDTRLALERAATGTDAEQAGQADVWQPVDLITYVLLPANASIDATALDRHMAEFATRHIDPELIAETDVSFGTIPVSELIVAFVDLVAGGALGIRVTSLILLVGLLILGMACLNYANLAAAQSFMRARHVGLLKVLGAKRRQVFAQALVEAAVLATAALALSVVAAKAMIPFARSESFDFTGALPLAGRLDVWLVLLALVAGVGLVAGGYPAFLLARIRPVRALRAGAGRGGPAFVRRLLVGIQFTTATVLLVVVMTMWAHNRDIRERGVDAIGEPVVVVSSELPDESSTLEALAAVLTRHPSVVSVTSTGLSPWSVDIDGATMSRAPGTSGPGLALMLNDVGHDYFETMNIDVLAGRVFSRERGSDAFFWGETPEDSMARPLHAVVDRSALERFGWSDPAEAVGETVHRRWSGFSRPVEIIGVVENVPYKLVSLGLGAGSIYFLQPGDTHVLLVRIVDADRQAALAHIEVTWDAFMPNIPIRHEFMEDSFEDAYSIFELFNLVFAALAGLAVLVACIGLYGAATYATSRRTHEIGVRKTLGASSRRIVAMLLVGFSKPVLVANLIGWPIAFLATQAYLSLFVFRTGGYVSPFVGSLAITLAVAGLAVAAQTIRAARVRPARVLRQE